MNQGARMATSATEIARLQSITASERAAELNAETRAWVEAVEGRWATTVAEDQAFWAEMGIHTGLDLECDSLASAISDSYKELHGIRPRWINFEAMNLNDLEAELEALRAEWAEHTRRAAEWEAQEALEAELAAQEAKEAQVDVWWTLQDSLEGVRVRA